MGKILESNTSSDIQFGSLLKAEFGALLKTAVVVAHGREPAQVVGVDAVQLDGNAGATTPSKFWAQGWVAETKVTLPIKPLGVKVGAPGTAIPP